MATTAFVNVRNSCAKPAYMNPYSISLRENRDSCGSEKPMFISFRLKLPMTIAYMKPKRMRNMAAGMNLFLRSKKAMIISGIVIRRFG